MTYLSRWFIYLEPNLTIADLVVAHQDDGLRCSKFDLLYEPHSHR
ncbi:unnamed protein product [Acidithrix sp. C25]|nr:unnamed protein product [Acidithrix sp. C25]